MSRDDALRQLADIQRAGAGDPELAHALADQVLIDLLRALGFADVADAWDAVDKWYA